MNHPLKKPVKGDSFCSTNRFAKLQEPAKL